MNHIPQGILPWSLADLSEYKNLDPKWQDWATVESVCINLAKYLFDKLGQDAGSGSSFPVPGQG